MQFQGPELGFSGHGAPQIEGPTASRPWLWGEIRDLSAQDCCSFPVTCSEAVLFICVSRQNIHGALMGDLFRDDLSIWRWRDLCLNNISGVVDFLPRRNTLFCSVLSICVQCTCVPFISPIFSMSCNLLTSFILRVSSMWFFLFPCSSTEYSLVVRKYTYYTDRERIRYTNRNVGFILGDILG